MSVFMVIVGFPWHLVRWAYNIVRAAELSVRLQAERKQLQGLRQLRDTQLTNLVSGQHLILPLYFQSLQLNIHNPDAEPHVTAQLRLLNGSVFTIQLQSPKFAAYLEGNPLTLAPTLVSGSLILPPGTGTTYQFRQPVMTPIKDSLINWPTREHYNPLRWKFAFEAECIVQETGDRFIFKPDVVYHQAIPW